MQLRYLDVFQIQFSNRDGAFTTYTGGWLGNWRVMLKTETEVDVEVGIELGNI